MRLEFIGFDAANSRESGCWF